MLSMLRTVGWLLTALPAPLDPLVRIADLQLNMGKCLNLKSKHRACHYDDVNFQILSKEKLELHWHAGMCVSSVYEQLQFAQRDLHSVELQMQDVSQKR